MGEKSKIYSKKALKRAKTCFQTYILLLPISKKSSTFALEIKTTTQSFLYLKKQTNTLEK